MKVLNLIKNNATFEQIQDGCFEVTDKQFVSYYDVSTKQEMVL